MNNEELLLEIAKLKEENKRLKNIIKEAMEYMRKNMTYFLNVTGTHTYKLLNILDKLK